MQIKGYRTLILNLLAAVLPVLQATGAADIGLTGTAAGIYAAGIAVANIVLRTFTTTPVGKAQ